MCSLIIPISGDISNLDHLKETLVNASKCQSEVVTILMFDNKGSKLSARNWDEISSWDFADLKLYSNTFSSVGAARNFGLSRADSKWVAFTDADDVTDVKNFISMMHEAELHNSDIAIGRFNSEPNFPESINLSHRQAWDSETFQIPFGLNPGLWRCGFRLTSLDGLHFPNLSMAEDQIFLSRFFQVDRKIHFSSLVVYTYSTEEENSLTKRPEQVRKITDAIQISLEHVRENKGPYSTLVETLAIAQILSGIKYGKIKVRIILLGRILKFLTTGDLVRMIRRFHILIKVLQR